MTTLGRTFLYIHYTDHFFVVESTPNAAVHHRAVVVVVAVAAVVKEPRGGIGFGAIVFELGAIPIRPWHFHFATDDEWLANWQWFGGNTDLWDGRLLLVMLVLLPLDDRDCDYGDW